MSRASHKPGSDKTPVRATTATGFVSHGVSRPDVHRLVVKPSRTNLIFGMAFSAFGTPFAVLPIASSRCDLTLQGLGELFTAVPGLCFVLMGLVIAFSPTRYELDRDDEVLRRRVLFFRKPNRDLTKVRAVQLLWNRQKVVNPDPGTDPFTHYFQVNLLLDDPDEPRINLTDFPDLDASHALAAEVAEFLKVPLVDQVPKGHIDDWDWEAEGGGSALG